MKNSLFLLAMVACISSCKDREVLREMNQGNQVTIAPFDDGIIETAVLYEANIRQYSPEGTFDAFTQDIPKLRDLGVKIIWLMPVHPVSEKNRKTTDGRMVEEIEDEVERAKYLGSYYAVSDYTEINKEFGTKVDFKELVDTAHENGMYVILDWVANHTGWDHHWLEENPEFYTTNEAGEIIDPIDPGTGESWGWTDTADLNYDNLALWKAMTAEMKYWVQEYDVDGFRADVAGEVPTRFWEQAVEEIERIRPLFMLAESEKKELFHRAFDMGYNWEGHHIMNAIGQGKKTVKDWDDYMQKIDTIYEDDDVLLNFVTNHDENSWSGTVKERMGDASETFMALTYTLPGMPLIYSGQEYDLDHRLKFFEKDSIPRTKGENWPVLVKLAELKNNSTALHGGKEAASYNRIKTSDDESILAFEREKDGERIIYLANLSEEPVSVTLDLKGTFENYMIAETVEIQEDQVVLLGPWEYRILVKH